MAPFVPFVFHLQSQDANFLFAGWLGKTKKIFMRKMLSDWPVNAKALHQCYLIGL